MLNSLPPTVQLSCQVDRKPEFSLYCKLTEGSLVLDVGTRFGFVANASKPISVGGCANLDGTLTIEVPYVFFSLLS